MKLPLVENLPMGLSLAEIQMIKAKQPPVGLLGIFLLSSYGD